MTTPASFCTSCGTQLTPGVRFCAGCGTPVAAASPAVPPPAPVAPPPGASPPAGPSAAPAAAPWVGGAAPASGPRSRSKVLTAVGAVAGVALLGGVGYAAYDRLTGPNGGADSPQAAVVALAAAASAEDPVTALSMLPPGEVGSLVPLYGDVRSKAVDAGFVEEGDPFDGLDLQVDGMTTQVEELGDDVAAVTVTAGTVSYDVDPAALAQPLQVDSDGEPHRATSGTGDLAQALSDAAGGGGARILTVQRDGRWYVSPTYTALELWRVDQDLPAPDFSSDLDLDATGADSPEAVVRDAVAAVGGYDVDGLLDLLSPDEAAALYHYRGAISTALNRDGALLELQQEGSVTVDEVDVEAGEERDGTVPVAVSSASGSVSSSDGFASWTLDRNCVSYSGDSDAGGGCLDEALTSRGLSADLAERFPRLVVLTEEHDGRWYLAPVATVAGEVRKLVAALDRDEVVRALGVPQFGTVRDTLVDGEPVSGSLDTPMASHVYELEAPEGSALGVCLDGEGVYADLYSPSGQPLDSSTSLVRETGLQRVVVNAFEGGDYEVTGRVTQVQDVGVPGEVPATGEGCGFSVFRFEAVADEPLLFSAPSGSFTATVTLPDGEVTDFTDVFVPTQTGPHLLSLVGTEAVVIEPAPDDLLLTGLTVSGLVGPTGGMQHEVRGVAGQTVEIRAVGTDGLDATLTLFGVEGSELASNDDTYGSDPAITWTFGSDGVHLVEVGGYSGSTGGYELTVQRQ